MEDYSVIAKVELSTITRQKHALYRDAVQSLANGEVLKAFDSFDKKLGVIKEADTHNRPALVASDYISAMKRGKKALIVNPTWKEHELILRWKQRHSKNDGLLKLNRAD